MDTRADKATDSWYDFGNYLTLGSFDLGKNIGAGLRYNAENMLNSPLDFINWMTIGGVDTIKGVVFPGGELFQGPLVIELQPCHCNSWRSERTNCEYFNTECFD